ncbi:MAG: ABC transporter ATP-binding protein, partial [Lachnospiraceae bacterium]|nr:ABC transporter ATP-binding protein [Lachnospiraceae bacterium]
VFDECNFPLGLKVKDVQKVMKNIYRTWEEGKFRDYMERFEIPLNKKIKELSKGMKMKLSIAAALSHDSRLLILDEATSGLDPVVRSEILDIFREFIEDEEHTIFISSHITSDIEKIADYVMLIHKGRLLFTEDKDKLLYNYGIVRCSKKQAQLIPSDLIVGKEEREYETSVLIRDKNKLEESGFFREAEQTGGSSCVVDRATIEDMLLYIVKS